MKVPSNNGNYLQDLVEALSAEGTWKVPHKIDQASYARNKDGKHTQFEDDPPFVYHDGYLSSHFASANYQEIDLTKLQQEAVWWFSNIPLGRQQCGA